MSFVSVLEHIGKDILSVFKGLETAAVAAEPFIDTALPSLAGVYNTVLSAVVQAQTLGEAAASTNPSATNTAKLAMVISAVTPSLTTALTTIGVPVNKTVITNYVNSVVAGLNTLPAPTSVPTPPAA